MKDDSVTEANERPDRTKNAVAPADTQPGTGTPAPRNDSTMPGETAPDLDDLAQFRVTQDFDTALGITAMETSVAVRTPRKDEWFHAHSTFAFNCFALRLGPDAGGDGESYLVNAEVAKLVSEVIKPVTLVLCENRGGVSFFWPVSVPDAARPNSWHLSDRLVLEQARKRWVRRVSQQSAGAYIIRVTEETLDAPRFERSPGDLLKLAMSRRGIKDPDHEIIRKLRFGA